MLCLLPEFATMPRFLIEAASAACISKGETLKPKNSIYHGEKPAWENSSLIHTINSGTECGLNSESLYIVSVFKCQSYLWVSEVTSSFVAEEWKVTLVPLLVM